MITIETPNYIVIDPTKKSEPEQVKGGFWFIGSKPGELPLNMLPEDDPGVITKNVEKIKIQANKWILEAATVLCSVTSIALIASIYNALTVSTVGANFELHQAPNIPIAITAGCLGLLSAATATFTHQGAGAWRTIEKWMTSHDLNKIDTARSPQYTRGIRF